MLRQVRSLLASSALAISVLPAFAQNIPGPHSLTTRFSYTATVPAAPAGTKSEDVWLPVPSDGPWQSVRDVTAQSSVPSKITRENKYGDRMVYLHVADPAGPLTVTVQFTVTRREVRVLAGSGPAAPKTIFPGVLAADRNVPVGGRFAAIASDVARGKTTPLEQERAFFDHVVSTMHYDYKKESPEYAQGDAAFVCDYKAGNCSDLHSYLISLSRTEKIPAVLEFGFPLTGIPVSDPLPASGTIPGYHCWTWFQDPQHGWVPLDAADARRWKDSGRADVSNALFGNLVLARSAVAMSRGRDIVLSPAQRGTPLNYFIYPYAEADGKPLAAKWTLSYVIQHSE